MADLLTSRRPDRQVSARRRAPGGLGATAWTAARRRPWLLLAPGDERAPAGDDAHQPLFLEDLDRFADGHRGQPVFLAEPFEAGDAPPGRVVAAGDGRPQDG